MNDLLLNADKYDVVIFGKSTRMQLAAVASRSPSPTLLKLLQKKWSLTRLTFNSQVTAICTACIYHIWAQSDIRWLLPGDVVNMLARIIEGSPTSHKVRTTM